ncbi:YetF domain-containing protein [Vreelandella rituensis]|uniref:DUF421 domain-containing protein n=1 Tax=Vreelandella rituensis TaxID=2282306 RepID=A0A368UBW0_9GAMM|nr:YetF domain-containing protein [Halomonas rituensis]RCV92903.1 DUF421 domain-containing protein [Halomonas rituensis]
METIFFDGWGAIVRTGIIGVLAYVALVTVLRISGKRTLSKMNAFDLIVTVALGSTLATILLSKDVSLAQGIAALGLLVGMQFVVTWSSVRARWVRQLVTGEPALVLYQGKLLPEALKSARVTEDEVRAAVRSAGLPMLEVVEAVVLETDGSFSVVQRSEKRITGPTLEGLSPAGSSKQNEKL